MPINVRNLITPAILPAASDPYADAARQRVLAEALQRRALQPRNYGTSTRGQAIAQGLTQLAEALIAQKSLKHAGQLENAANIGTQRSNEKLASSLGVPGIVDELAAQDPRAVNQALLSIKLARAFPAPAKYGAGAAGSGIYNEATGEIVSHVPDKPAEAKSEYTPTPVAGTVNGKLTYARVKANMPGYFDDMGNPIQGFTPKEPVSGVTVNMSGDKAWDVARANSESKALDNYQTNAQSAVKFKQSLARMQSLNQDSLSGGGANARLAVANWMRGWTGIDLTNKVDSSQNFQSAANKAVLDMIGGSLGRQISDQDRAFIERIVPQLTQSQSARDQLATYLSKQADNEISLYHAAQNYVNKTGRLTNFDEFSVRDKLNGQNKDESASPRSFNSEAEAAAAGLKPGTKVVVGGVTGTWQ